MRYGRTGMKLNIDEEWLVGRGKCGLLVAVRTLYFVSVAATAHKK